MSELSIWQALRAGGLTAAGAAGLMGNMQAESAMRANNVQDCFGLNDEEYTRDVDNGRIDRAGFANGKIGYGLCQWTEQSRQRNLYDFAVLYGASIGDEAMQVAFSLYEFPCVAPDTWNLCCTSDDVKTCCWWICHYYENPAVKNDEERYRYAMQFFNKFKDEQIDDNCGCTDCQIPAAEENIETCDITVRVLKKGSKGRDVRMAQIALIDMGYQLGNDDGDFGNKTLTAVNAFKEKCNLNPDGVIDQAAWQVMFQ